MMKRALSIFLTGVFLLGLLPTAALAVEADSGGLCPHHQEHSFEDCGYVEAAEEVPCNMGCSETVEDSQIIHVEGCTYTPAVEGHPCGYVCPICPVQALIDALPDPEGITLDNAEDAAARLAAIDGASETLTEEERAALDFTRYKAVMLALAALMDDTPTLLATESGIKYLDWDDSQKKLVEKTYTGSATVVDSSATTWGAADGKEHWYVVQEGKTVTFDKFIDVTGNVHLILTNGSTLNARKGIEVNRQGSNSLTIYAQSIDEAVMGTLTATGDFWRAGIECITGQALTINGGSVTATGGTNGAGIGGSDGINGDGGAITINGGNIRATGGSRGAGIGGGGDEGSGGTITINGGTVEAIGPTGIGGGDGGSDGEITISGGSVTANSYYGAGIGGGCDTGSGGTIIISGGKVTATSTSGGAGIGGGTGGDGGTFTTGADGSAFFAASSIQNQDSEGSWSGAIFKGNDGQVYGNQTLKADMEISGDKKLTIPDGSKLTINNGTTLTNNGTIQIDQGGTLENNGILTGNGHLQVAAK